MSAKALVCTVGAAALAAVAYAPGRREQVLRNRLEAAVPLLGKVGLDFEA